MERKLRTLGETIGDIQISKLTECREEIGVRCQEFFQIL